MSLWRLAVVGVVSLSMGAAGCATLAGPDPGDAAFAAGDVDAAVAHYRRAEAEGRLGPHRRLRFALALAVSGDESEREEARRVAAQAAAAGDDGSAAAVQRLLDHLGAATEQAESCDRDRGRLESRADIVGVVAANLGACARSLQEQVEALEAQLDATGDDLSARRRELRAAAARIEALEQQIDQLKRIDLAGDQ